MVFYRARDAYLFVKPESLTRHDRAEKLLGTFPKRVTVAVGESLNRRLQLSWGIRELEAELLAYLASSKSSLSAAAFLTLWEVEPKRGSAPKAAAAAVAVLPTADAFVGAAVDDDGAGDGVSESGGAGDGDYATGVDGGGEFDEALLAEFASLLENDDELRAFVEEERLRDSGAEVEQPSGAEPAATALVAGAAGDDRRTPPSAPPWRSGAPTGSTDVCLSCFCRTELPRRTRC
jgi:hypothetical protein